ncbi:MAG: GTPase domain-containing protein [Chloroflexi bacterium]|nr:GTPase domain-containing protein [Chloroflexota bacterium]
MSLVNSNTNEIHCKIVYCGPSLSGKTANLESIDSRAPDTAKGELLTLSTEAEPPLLFDFLPLDMGMVKGRKLRFHLYTIPRQALGDDTCSALLDGVDGVVFVADSGRNRFRDNVESFNEMERAFSARGKPVGDIPLVIQFNKRDIVDAVPLPILNARMNPVNAPRFQAVASRGIGVFTTLRAIGGLVVANLQ